MKTYACLLMESFHTYPLAEELIVHQFSDVISGLLGMMPKGASPALKMKIERFAAKHGALLGSMRNLGHAPSVAQLKQLDPVFKDVQEILRMGGDPQHNPDSMSRMQASMVSPLLGEFSSVMSNISAGKPLEPHHFDLLSSFGMSPEDLAKINYEIKTGLGGGARGSSPEAAAFGMGAEDIGEKLGARLKGANAGAAQSIASGVKESLGASSGGGGGEGGIAGPLLIGGGLIGAGALGYNYLKNRDKNRRR